MAKTKISEYSSTASNNTDVDGINIAEGMAPSNVNNAMREIMAQLKDWQSGAVSQDMYVNGAFTASGNAVLSADLSVGDDLTVTGKANISGASVITTGTYSRTGTTVTVTKNSHGFENNQILYLAFSSGTGGSATSGAYAISNVATNTFDVTDTASGSISGTPSVTITRGAISASGLVVSSPLAVGGNATISGTLSAGSTSLGAATFSGAVIMSSTLAANGNVTVGTSTTNSHTLNGSLTVGTSTSNTVTLNTLLSAGGGTGTSGQYLKSRGTSDTPIWDTVTNSVKAWVNFDGATAANVNGTYSQSGTTVTVTITGHGLIAGNVIYSDITSGTGVDGTYTVATVTDANTFTYTAGTSLTTSGNITLLRRAIRASGNVGSVTWINATGRFYINFSTVLADSNYAVLISGSGITPAFGAANIGNLATVPTTGSFGITYESGGGTAINPQYGYVTVIGG